MQPIPQSHCAALAFFKKRFHFVSAIFLILVLLPGISWAKTLGRVLHDVGAVSEDMELVPQQQGLLFSNLSDSGLSSFVKPGTLKRAGFILPGTVHFGEIIKNFNNHIRFGAGETVFVDLGTEEGSFVGTRYLIYRQGEFVYHPVYAKGSGDNILTPSSRLRFDSRGIRFFEPHNRKPLGYRVVILGELEVTEAGLHQSRATILQSYADISVGDPVIPFEKEEIPDEPDELKVKDVQGYIVATQSPNLGLGDHEIIYLDVGANQNVEPGDRFEVIKTPTTGTYDISPVVGMRESSIRDPDFMSKDAYYFGRVPQDPLVPVVIGEVQVISTQENTSTAVVRESKFSMQIGQRIRYKR